MDTQLINELLDTYTRSVSTADRKAFEQILLAPDIPFYGLSGRLPAKFEPSLKSVQDYAGFRKAVFESGEHLAQRFSDVRIEQDGDLAQVSLHFETRVVGTADGGQGWKVLQLLKVGGHWKIASEFYTVYALKADGR